MLIAISIGHRGRPDKAWKDWGAKGIPRDPEAYHVRNYVGELDVELSALGHDVVVLSDGTFTDRWERADGYGADVYLAAHLNAGGGDYGAWFYDHRTADANGKDLAETIAARCHLYATPDVKHKAIASRGGDWTANAYATIRGVKCTAICMEPLFIDNPRHASYLVPWGYHKIAKEIAGAIDEWGK